MNPFHHDQAHPTDRQLASYRDGRLGSAEEDEIQEHLVACQECRATLLNLAEFQELMETEDLAAVAEPGALPSPEQTEASWQAVRARLSSGGGTETEPRLTVPPAPRPPERVRRRFPSKPTLALAAALIACLIGFPLWIATHGETGSGGLSVAPPLGGGEVTRGETAPTTVRLEEAPAVLSLALPPRAAYPAYRFEVRSQRGDLLLTAPAALVPVAAAPGSPAAGRRSPRLVALALDRGQLPPGDYRVRLVGVRGSQGETLSEQALRVPAP